MNNAESERKLFSKRDILPAALLLFVAAAAFFAFSFTPRAQNVSIEKNGELLLSESLAEPGLPKELTVSGENGVSLTVLIESDGVSVTAADCPDKVCLRTGKITRSGETIICLPARVLVRLEGSGGADTQTF